LHRSPIPPNYPTRNCRSLRGLARKTLKGFSQAAFHHKTMLRTRDRQERRTDDLGDVLDEPHDELYEDPRIVTEAFCRFGCVFRRIGQAGDVPA
jgi:hypothetical protein